MVKVVITGVSGLLGSTMARYLVAKGIEWTNKESFVLGLSEILIYSGKNRPIEIAYLNASCKLAPFPNVLKKDIF